jgi:hypothetical protein
VILPKNECREGRLTRLICFDRRNRFNHHDFRVMAAGTSTVWALPVKVDTFRVRRDTATIAIENA